MEKVAVPGGFDRMTGEPKDEFEFRCSQWQRRRFLQSHKTHDRYWVHDGEAYADWTTGT